MWSSSTLISNIGWLSLFSKPLICRNYQELIWWSILLFRASSRYSILLLTVRLHWVGFSVNIRSNLFLFAHSALKCHLGNNITSRRNISCFTYRMFSSGKNGLGLQYNPFNRRQNDCTQLWPVKSSVLNEPLIVQLWLICFSVTNISKWPAMKAHFSAWALTTLAANLQRDSLSTKSC